MRIFVFCEFLSYCTVNARLFGDQNDQRKKFYRMVPFEDQSLILLYFVVGTPRNYPTSFDSVFMLIRNL